MKTNFLSFGILSTLLFTLFVPNINATEVQLSFFEVTSVFVDGDEPNSYAARIKRFRHNSQGLDYFDPTFVEALEYVPRISPKADLYKTTPYEFKNFTAWAKVQNNPEIWRYTVDENYRNLVNNWNQINNRFWAFAISEGCPSGPFGTFDFTMGLGNANEVIAFDYLNNAVFGYNVPLYKLRLSNALGRPYYGKVNNTNPNNRPIGLAKLPTRDLKTTTVKQHAVQKPNFTKHVPVSVQWNRGQGVSYGTNKNQSVISKWERSKSSAGPSRYDSLIANPGISSNNQSSTNNNQQYNNLSSGNKSNTISTSSPNTSNASYRRTTAKKSTKTTNNGN